jgi:hypothetical protein
MLDFERLLGMVTDRHDLPPVLLHGAGAVAGAARLRAAMTARGCGTRDADEVPMGRGVDQRRQVGVIELPKQSCAQHHYKHLCERSSSSTWWLLTTERLHAALPGLRSLCIEVACAAEPTACPAFDADLRALLLACGPPADAMPAWTPALAAALKTVVDRHIAKGACLSRLTRSVGTALTPRFGTGAGGGARVAEIVADLDAALARCRRPLMYGLLFERAVTRALA